LYHISKWRSSLLSIMYYNEVELGFDTSHYWKFVMLCSEHSSIMHSNYFVLCGTDKKANKFGTDQNSAQLHYITLCEPHLSDPVEKSRKS